MNNNDEIRELLRDLAAKADAEGSSGRVTINLGGTSGKDKSKDRSGASSKESSRSFVDMDRSFEDSDDSFDAKRRLASSSSEWEEDADLDSEDGSDAGSSKKASGGKKGVGSFFGLFGKGSGSSSRKKKNASLQMDEDDEPDDPDNYDDLDGEPVRDESPKKTSQDSFPRSARSKDESKDPYGAGDDLEDDPDLDDLDADDLDSDLSDPFHYGKKEPEASDEGSESTGKDSSGNSGEPKKEKFRFGKRKSDVSDRDPSVSSRRQDPEDFYDDGIDDSLLGDDESFRMDDPAPEEEDENIRIWEPRRSANGEEAGEDGSGLPQTGSSSGLTADGEWQDETVRRYPHPDEGRKDASGKEQVHPDDDTEGLPGAHTDGGDTGFPEDDASDDEGSDAFERLKSRKFSTGKKDFVQKGFESDEDDFLEDEEEEASRSARKKRAKKSDGENTGKQRQKKKKTREKKAGGKENGTSSFDVGDGGGSGGGIRIPWKILLILLAVAAVVLVVLRIVQMQIGAGRKSENVSAEEGLKVTVEKEPKDWARSAEIELGISAGSEVQSVTVNGIPVEFPGKKRGKITLNTSSDLLDVMVVTDSVRRAQVNLQKIDSKDPEVRLVVTGATASIEASDERSGIENVYYGTVSGYSDVPLLQPYTEPFPIRSGTTYCYFAVDHAGNVAGPYITDMTQATAAGFDVDEISLFPGESEKLKLVLTPEKGYLNGLTYTSSNPDVVTVSEDGVLTGQKEGIAMVEVSAEGIAPAQCSVVVRGEVEVTISAVGDISLGEDEYEVPMNSFSSMYSNYGVRYFFENIRPELASDNLTFGNLEGALSLGAVRAEGKEKAYIGLPEYANILADGNIEAVSLANNHRDDYGLQGIEDTQANLEAAEVAYFYNDTIVYRTFDGVKVGLIGVNALDSATEAAELTKALIGQARMEGADVIVTAFHWGKTEDTIPSQEQRDLAHAAVDAGANMVVGHHPHVLQGIEEYKGVYIAYSLGNFCFGPDSNPKDLDSMIFRVKFRIGDGGNITGSEMKVIPCTCSSSTTWNNYQPTPSVEYAADKIINKVRTLSQPFGTKIE